MHNSNVITPNYIYFKGFKLSNSQNINSQTNVLFTLIIVIYLTRQLVVMLVGGPYIYGIIHISSIKIVIMPVDYVYFGTVKL